MSAESDRRTETIPQWKRDEVEELVDFIDGYDSIGIVGVAGIPSRQLQQMRADLEGSAALRMSRNTLVRRALDAVDAGLEDLDGYVEGQVGLIGTDDNPFTLFKRLEESKTPAPINAGETAPNDIVIHEGDTGMDPGPFVGELQAVGAQAQILEGSIKVTATSTVAEAGEEVSDQLAAVLAELEIEPKEVGLDLRAVFADGVIFEADELAIDVDEYRTDVQTAVARARNLSINAGYPTAQTLPAMVAKAAGEAKSLGLHAAIESPDLAGDLVSRADAQMRALAAQIDDEEALPEELRGIEAEPTPTPAPTEEEPEDDQSDQAAEDEDEPEPADEEEEDVSGEGLGDLFG